MRAIFTGWEDSLSFVTFLLIFGTFLLERVKFQFSRLFLFATPIVLFCFLFSYKRAYYVAIFVGILSLFWYQGSKTRIRLIALLLVSFILMGLLITAAGQWNAIGMRLESILNPTKESSANYRLIEWQNALISIKNNPLFGLGLGGVMPMEIWLSRTNLLGVHNTFLWIAVKLGMFGLFTYLFLHFGFLFHLNRLNTTLKDPYLRALSIGLTCAFIAFCGAQMFAPMFAQIRTATWLGIVFGLGMQLEIYQKDNASGNKER
jgi:O-antigen ligase